MNNTHQKEYIKNHSIAEQFAYKIRQENRVEKLRVYAPIILLCVITAAAAIFVDRFFSPKNIANLLYQMSIPLVMASGITFVLIIGSIDLSMEGVMGFSGAAISLLVANSITDYDFGIWGMIVTVTAGILVGCLTGYLHVKLRIASFIISYAMGSIITGFGVMTYRGTPASVYSELFTVISQKIILGIPLLTWISFLLFGFACYILNYTAFGCAVYAIGNNELAARSAGINIEKTKIKVFAFSAFMASCSGILACIRLKFGQVSIGSNQLFPVITACVLGGVSLWGGKGGLLQTFVGVLMYTELSNILTILGVDANYKQLVQSIIIVLAVIITTSRDRQIIAK